MYLNTLHLQHFRNYCEQQVEFSAPKTILVGENAQGKSNLLEAVELLATLRSHRAVRDREFVQDQEAIAQITATVQRALSTADLGLTLRSNGRRTVTLNGENLKRKADFLGTMNAVQFSSLDLELVRGGPGERRAWVDTLLIQLEPIYSAILEQYNHVLRQRNALLKQQRSSFGSSSSFGNSASTPIDPTQMAIWDAQLAATGTRVIRRRARVLARLAHLAQTWHQSISDRREQLAVNYAPNVAMETDDPT
ncbi:MAG TPA: DNA replication and repair protein RecF, partial [Chroococcidiopsis sp.]